MIDINTLRFEVQLNKLDNSQLTLSPLVIEDLLDRLEAAEKSDAESIAMYRKARDERDALRTKIEAMEKQKPVAWGVFHFGGKRNGKLYSHCESEKQARMYILDRHQSDDSNTFREAPLYALPGAQPAPSVPDDIVREVLRDCCGTFHGSRHRITCEKYKGKKAPEAKP